MGRYQTATFTTGSVSPSGGVLDYELTIPASGIDISRIKITPSISAGTQIVEIFLTAARAASDLLYSTKAWTATYFADPADSTAVAGLQGWVVPYFDSDETAKLHLRFTNNHTVAKTYDVEIDYEYTSTSSAGVEGVPESLYATAIANGLTITSGVIAGKNNSGIIEAEFRATRLSTGVVDSPQDLRLVSEGGSFVPDGISKLSVTAITATPSGAQYIWTSASAGRWYYVWRVKNATGWSRWTDGNITPQYVTQYVDTQEAGLADVGPPADWEVWIEPGPSTGTIIVHASRPRTNGTNLLWWAIQVKDGSSGSWIALDNGTAPSEVKYDGSLVAHTLSADKHTITKATAGWGTATAGDLILLDVRGGNFDVNHCQWAILDTTPSGTSITLMGFFRPQTLSDLRLKIVAPPAGWIGSGYLGDQDNAGMWPTGEEAALNQGLGLGWIFGNYTTEEFVSTPISIPTAVTNPEARVWFENVYCRSDNDLTHSTGMSSGVGVFTTPRIFTNFNDRDFWLPVYPHPNWGTLAFNSDGTVNMTCQSPSATEAGQSGIRSRFKLYPDSSGYIQVQATFTGVTIPVGTAVGDYFLLALLGTDAMQDTYTVGVALLSKDAISAQVALDKPYIITNYYASSYYGGATGGNVYYARTPNYTRPPASSIVDLRFTIGERDWSGWQKTLSCYSVEARTGGSGGYTSARPTWADDGSHLGIRGVQLFIGLIGNRRFAGATAKLTQLNILSGIAEYA